MLAELSVSCIGLPPIGIPLLAQQLAKRKGLNDPAAVLVDKLRKGWKPPAVLTPSALADLSRSRRIERVCEKPVGSNAIDPQKNSEGVWGVVWKDPRLESGHRMLGVPATELTPENIVLAPRKNP